MTVLLAGRPMFIDKILADSSAVIHAFLPGTSGGQGIVDAIVGSYVMRPNGQSDKKNSLSFDWPKNAVIIDFKFRLHCKISLYIRQTEKSLHIKIPSSKWVMDLVLLLVQENDFMFKNIYHNIYFY